MCRGEQVCSTQVRQELNWDLSVLFVWFAILTILYCDKNSQHEMYSLHHSQVYSSAVLAIVASLWNSSRTASPGRSEILHR